MPPRIQLRATFQCLIGLALSQLAVAHAAPSPADSVHFCGVFDYEQWRREHPRPAGKRLADLDVGEPRTVRMIYFLPNDRLYRAEVVQKMKDEIVRIQDFYAEQMQAHGHGNRTFRIETDAQGEPLVHRVNGQHPERHYSQHDTADEILEETHSIFDIEANVYLIVIDSRDSILSYGDPVGGVGTRWTKNGGFALVDGNVWFDTAAHELGHAFGLDHDFRDDTYIMSYGSLDSDRGRLSACNAEFLAVHTYFNRNSSISASNSARPTSQLISSPWYPPGSASVPIRLKFGSLKGLHQVLWLGKTREPHSAAGSWEVKACRGFAGEKEAVVEFAYDGKVPSSPGYSLSSSGLHGLIFGISDVDGSIGYGAWNLVEMSPYLVATWEGDKGVDIRPMSFSPDGTMLATGDGFSGITLWDVASRRKIVTWEGYTGYIEAVWFSPDGTMLATGGYGGIILWDVASRRKIVTLEGYRSYIEAVWFSPDGTMLATGDGFSGITLWDVASRRKIVTWEMVDKPYGHSASFSPDGAVLASGLGDGTIRLRDVASGRNIATLEGHTGRVYPVWFSPDGTLLASGSEDETIALWDVASRRKIATLEGHTSYIAAMSFSPDGAVLASGSGDGTIRLWDVASRRNIATFGHPSSVRSMSFSPDGAVLASGSRDGTIQLWDVTKATVAQPPHSLAKVSGDGQQGPANTRLAKPLVVSVSDQDGSPITGVRVVFSTGGRGLLSPISDADPCAVGSAASSIASYTDANGQASVRLTLGSQVGYSVKATVEGLNPVIFIATKSGQAMPHRLTKVCGDAQEGLVDEQLAEPFVVSVSAENGVAMAGVAVSFSVTAGGGTLSSATATTDANGRAATSLTLGSEAGTNMVVATVEGLESVTFTAAGEKSALASMFDAFGSGKQVALPDRTQLLQNAPNPFNSQTVLSYFLLEPGPARLEVFALTGQRVAVLHQGPQQAGYHRLHWDGRAAAGHPVASGAYLYRLVTDEAVLTRKLILLR